MTQIAAKRLCQPIQTKVGAKPRWQPLTKHTKFSVILVRDVIYPASISRYLFNVPSAELRARFDNGDDPNDPTQGQGGGNPFNFGGGHPFQNVFFQAGSPFSGHAGGRRGGHGNTHFQWTTW